jgi:hypothetical protein
MRFPPRGQVTVTVTNGIAVVQLASANAVTTWQNAQYDGTDRPLIPGVWVFDASDLNDSPPCAIQVRSSVSTQLATVTLSA